MKITIKYTSTKYFDRSNFFKWIFIYRKYNYINGFILRIFGIYINVMEKDGLKKLLEISRNKRANI